MMLVLVWVTWILLGCLKICRNGIADRPNSVAARVDQVVYRGFVSHYYLTTASGEQLIVFEQNQSQHSGFRYTVGQEVVASWNAPSNHGIARH